MSAGSPTGPDVDMRGAMTKAPPPAAEPSGTIAPGPALAVVVLAEIDRWFIETFHQRGIEVSEFSHYRAQADALKARLVAALSDKEK